MNQQSKSLVFTHLSVFLFGFSALFAKLVKQPSIVITFGRLFFSSVFLFTLTRFSKPGLKLNSKRDYLLMVFSGAILAVHWFCFIQSIQVSSVAVGTITFSTFPLFTSFLEPLFFKEKIKARFLFCSIVMLLGVFILSQSSNNSESFQKINGIVFGLISSLTYAVLSLLNRNFSEKYKPETIVLYEQASAAIVILPFIILIKPAVSINDLIMLCILGIIFTAIAHGLFVKSLRYVKVSTAGIISALEAVYSIILASLLLREVPAVNEIIGGIIVIIMAGYMTLFREKQSA